MRCKATRLPPARLARAMPTGSAPAFALALGMSLAGLTVPCLAQSAPASPGGPAYGTPGLSEPTSNQASNIGASDTQSAVAPSLPSPDLGPSAGTEAYLRSARVALATGRTGEAQEAMEMAETRLLDRSTPLFRTDQPDGNPLVSQIQQALHALGNGDRAGAIQILDSAIPMARTQ